jgi:hypothetical protein
MERAKAPTSAGMLYLRYSQRVVGRIAMQVLVIFVL